MEWYYWVLIGIGIAAVGALKLYFWGKITNKSKAKQKPEITDED